MLPNPVERNSEKGIVALEDHKDIHNLMDPPLFYVEGCAQTY